MKSTILVPGGDLTSAISQLAAELREEPTDTVRRTSLFELLCCAGELDRAGKQLDVIGTTSAEQDAAVQRYRDTLEGERKRRQTFATGRAPQLPATPPQYTKFHLEAIQKIRAGRFDDARVLLEQSEGFRLPVAVRINGETFDDLKDADDLIGPFLEVISADSYSWFPWDSVRMISIEPPRHLRDLIWLPARLELDSGPIGEVFLPVLYVGSYDHPDQRIKLGQMTEWRNGCGGLSLGSGQRLLAADERDWPLLEIRELVIEPAKA